MSESSPSTSSLPQQKNLPLLTLYDFPFSLDAQKVRLTLQEKGLSWETKLINLLTHENVQPEYMRINPRGVVPTLVHNGRIITDSVKIMQYLDAQFPNPALIPTERTARERMESWLTLQDQLPMNLFTYSHNQQGLAGKFLEKSTLYKARLMERLLSKNPDLSALYVAKLEDMETMLKQLGDRSLMDKSKRKLVQVLDQLENHLKTYHWIAGDNFSLADIAWAVVLGRLEMLEMSNLWQNNTRPHIAGYINRLKARPTYAKAQIYTEFRTQDAIPYQLGPLKKRVKPLLLGAVLAFLLGLFFRHHRK